MDSPLEETGFEPLVPRRKTCLSPSEQKSVEQQLDAKDEAWPTGRQRSQAMLPFTRARNLTSPQPRNVG
jgi:hypothetical protein